MGGFRLFCGVIADPDYWIEELLSFVDEQTPFGATRGEILALLRLSEALTDRLALQRYTPGSGNRAAKIQVPRWTRLLHCHEALRFSDTDLANLEIDRASLRTFCLTSEMRRSVADALLWNSSVDEHPIIGDESGITIIAPSCIGRAVLRRLVTRVAAGMGGWANMFFQTETATTFVNKVLHRLDVQPLAFRPPEWPSDVPPMMPYFGQFDRDKAVIGISYSGELTAAAADPAGTDSLTEEQQLALEKYVRECAALLDENHGLSAGLVLINLSAVNRIITFRFTREIPNWHVRMAMLPDWLTLVDTAECSAMRLWKLSTHELLFQQHHIQVLNLAGLLNLFAFWKRNGFQLIPHRVDFRDLSFINIDSDFAVAIRAEVTTGPRCSLRPVT